MLYNLLWCFQWFAYKRNISRYLKQISNTERTHAHNDLIARLQVQTTYNAKRVYTDSASEDLHMWEPTLPIGYFMIGHYA